MRAWYFPHSQSFTFVRGERRKRNTEKSMLNLATLRSKTFSTENPWVILVKIGFFSPFVVENIPYDSIILLERNSIILQSGQNYS
jgi:hypothetical protein